MLHQSNFHGVHNSEGLQVTTADPVTSRWKPVRAVEEAQLAAGPRHQLQTLVQKEPPGVCDFTLLPSSAGSLCGPLNRRRAGLTPAVPPRDAGAARCATTSPWIRYSSVTFYYMLDED